jgi:hypothetical protein
MLVDYHNDYEGGALMVLGSLAMKGDFDNVYDHHIQNPIHSAAHHHYFPLLHHQPKCLNCDH